MDLGEKFVIRSNSLEPKQGKILISEPLMNDFHFGRSVILLIDHVEAEGSFGIIINKKLEVQVNHVVDEFPTSKRLFTSAVPWPTTSFSSSTPWAR